MAPELHLSDHLESDLHHMPNKVKSQSAIDHLVNRLDCLECPDGDLIKLVQFHHQSPGLIALRRKMATAIVYELEKDHSIRKRPKAHQRSTDTSDRDSDKADM